MKRQLPATDRAGGYAPGAPYRRVPIAALLRAWSTWIEAVRRCHLSPRAQHCPGKSRIGEPQLIEREFRLWLARIDWWRGVDFGDRFSHEQALANEFSESQVRHPQGVQTPREAQEQIGDHRGDDLQADGVVVVADELAKIEMLLDPAEQEFDLPAALVEGRNLDCPAVEIG